MNTIGSRVIKAIETRRHMIAHEISKLEREKYFLEQDVRAREESLRVSEFVQNWCAET